MSNTTWKNVERRVAKTLDGKRTGPTGRQGPDVVSEWLCVEVKHRARLPQWLTGTVAKIRSQAGPDRLGIVVLHERGMRGGIVCMSLHDFKAWFDGTGAVSDGGGQ